MDIYVLDVCLWLQYRQTDACLEKSLFLCLAARSHFIPFLSHLLSLMTNSNAAANKNQHTHHVCKKTKWLIHSQNEYQLKKNTPPNTKKNIHHLFTPISLHKELHQQFTTKCFDSVNLRHNLCVRKSTLAHVRSSDSHKEPIVAPPACALLQSAADWEGRQPKLSIAPTVVSVPSHLRPSRAPAFFLWRDFGRVFFFSPSAVSMQSMFPESVGTGPEERRWFSLIIYYQLQHLSDFTILERLAGPLTLDKDACKRQPSSPPVSASCSDQLPQINGCHWLPRGAVWWIIEGLHYCSPGSVLPVSCSRSSCMAAMRQSRLSPQSARIIWCLTTVTSTDRIVLASHQSVKSLVFIGSYGNTICFRRYLMLPIASTRGGERANGYESLALNQLAVDGWKWFWGDYFIILKTHLIKSGEEKGCENNRKEESIRPQTLFKEFLPSFEKQQWHHNKKANIKTKKIL